METSILTEGIELLSESLGQSKLNLRLPTHRELEMRQVSLQANCLVLSDEREKQFTIAEPYESAVSIKSARNNVTQKKLEITSPSINRFSVNQSATSSKNSFRSNKTAKKRRKVPLKDIKKELLRCNRSLISTITKLELLNNKITKIESARYR